MWHKRDISLNNTMERIGDCPGARFRDKIFIPTSQIWRQETWKISESKWSTNLDRPGKLFPKVAPTNQNHHFYQRESQMRDFEKSIR